MKMGQRISTDGTVENPVNAIDNMPVYRYTKSRGDQYAAERFTEKKADFPLPAV